jgi:ribosomal protein S2
MSYPLIQIDERKIVLLSGFRSEPGKHVVVTAKRELQAAAKRHSDAVAFGYVSGRWMPAA